MAVYGKPETTQVYRYSGGNWELVQEVGLNQDSNQSSANGIFSTDNGKTIWFTTGPGWPGQGVIRFAPKTGDHLRLTTDDGLAENGVSAVCQDRSGDVWFATYAGISRYSP